mmetsp:Transcript_10644/g.44601  ORF Transcript_10644/g.44601 Transcript_10644/m.44601 type:complete len:243 (+) Transcript_10644:947-1675(+)
MTQRNTSPLTTFVCSWHRSSHTFSVSSCRSARPPRRSSSAPRVSATHAATFSAGSNPEPSAPRNTAACGTDAARSDAASSAKVSRSHATTKSAEPASGVLCRDRNASLDAAVSTPAAANASPHSPTTKRAPSCDASARVANDGASLEDTRAFGATSSAPARRTPAATSAPARSAGESARPAPRTTTLGGARARAAASTHAGDASPDGAPSAPNRTRTIPSRVARSSVSYVSRGASDPDSCPK